jgi:hypothetical protein
MAHAIRMISGIAAALTLVIVMLYSARRSVPAIRTVGPSRWYLALHLWGGGLFFLLLLVHTAFRLPRGGLPFVLWMLSMWVVATGVVGWLLQRTLPRVLERSSSFEVNLLRIPELVQGLRKRAEALAGGAEPRIKSYYEQRIAPDMMTPVMVTAVLVQQKARIARPRQGELDILARTLTPAGAATLDALCDLHATKREIDVQYTLQRILRGWLLFHLPVAIALFGVVGLHIFFVVYY